MFSKMYINHTEQFIAENTPYLWLLFILFVNLSFSFFIIIKWIRVI